ncbi:carbonate dehydratase [Phaeovibrio sulfidiphilus]|uniref:carbonate dehydratase n=1 Tax=Phaeovibrio sulfidiphilus TaxID=1220600 RepID=UPI00237A13BE|nr:carbonate dehydratase [Phaeovibrio sulfidiphilus]
MPPPIDMLFRNNRNWAVRREELEPGYFRRLSAIQEPKYLWIGCSDSRVPANEIVGLDSGELFVHRNIANVVPHSDLNCISVIEYAINVLRVEHIIISGHYGCGGVRAALSCRSYGKIDHWLAYIKDVASQHRVELDAIETPEAKVDRLCELNVIHQVQNVARMPQVQNAWHRGQELQVHGWIYSLNDGLVRDLNVTITGPEALPDMLRLDVSSLNGVSPVVTPDPEAVAAAEAPPADSADPAAPEAGEAAEAQGQTTAEDRATVPLAPPSARDLAPETAEEREYAPVVSRDARSTAPETAEEREYVRVGSPTEEPGRAR